MKAYDLNTQLFSMLYFVPLTGLLESSKDGSLNIFFEKRNIESHRSAVTIKLGEISEIYLKIKIWVRIFLTITNIQF